jgi:hypothetical protein
LIIIVFIIIVVLFTWYFALGFPIIAGRRGGREKGTCTWVPRGSNNGSLANPNGHRSHLITARRLVVAINHLCT